MDCPITEMNDAVLSRVSSVIWWRIPTLPAWLLLLCPNTPQREPQHSSLSLSLFSLFPSLRLVRLLLHSTRLQGIASPPFTLKHVKQSTRKP